MPQQPQQVGPQPVPQSITVGEAQGPTGKFIVVSVTSPTGQYVMFLDPDAAERFAVTVADQAMHAKTGLVVASGLGGLNGVEH